tara:strand:+ start:300 stop:569 length:270 start_codon:yes stop_codon:yes gene_type:complete
MAHETKEKITLPTETWVELYGVLSNYVLEYSSLDPITKIEPNGDEVYTEEKQDEYNDIVDDVEDILRTFFTKNGGFLSPEHLESYHEKK